VNGLIILYYLNREKVNDFVTEKTENFRKSNPEEQEMLIPEGVADEEEATLDELHPEEQTAEEQAGEEQTGEEQAAEKQAGEETDVSSMPSEESVPPTQTSYSSGPVYYVVAGVFSIESNADNLVAELRSQGYNAEKFGKIGNTYAVSYGGFNNRAEAIELLRQVKANHNAGAWIKEVK
jgi:cell division septation protein DedD